MKFYKPLLLFIACIIFNQSYSQHNGFFLQISPQFSIINHSNLVIDENTNNSSNIPTISPSNPNIRIGLFYRISLKNNFFLKPGLSFSNFTYEVNHNFYYEGNHSVFESSNRNGIIDLSLSLIKAVPVFKNSVLLLDFGIGYSYIFSLGGTGKSSFYSDSNSSGITTMMQSVDWDIMNSSPEIHGGIRFTNPNILKNRLEFGLSYYWMFNNVPGLHVSDFINTGHFKYNASPNISMLSIDLIFNLYKKPK